MQERRNNMEVSDNISVREYPDGIIRVEEKNKGRDGVASTVIQEYIRKDIVYETVKTAEDHAYFAGQEKLREKMLEWAKEKEEYALTRAVKLAYKTMIDKIEEI